MDNINFKKVLDDGELFDQQANYEENFEKINQEVIPKITDLETNKVDKETGKGLSTNDFDNTYKQKIDTDIPAQLNDKANKVQEGWKNATLVTGSTVSGHEPRYYKNDFGEVIAQGRVYFTSQVASNILTFDAGYRPSRNCLMLLQVGVDKGVARCVVQTSGVVTIYPYTNMTVDFVDLSMIKFTTK